MLRVVLGGKIHRASVTGCELEYEGSLEVDQDLLDKVDMVAGEKVEVYNISNGARFSTYLIAGKRESKVVCVKGAAARLCEPGDKIIIVTYRMIDESEVRTFKPRILRMEEESTPTGQ